MDTSPERRQYAARPVALSTRIYRVLLAAYPSDFRQAYGRHMTQAFRDACRETYAADGSRGLLVLWCHTLADLVRTAMQEQADRLTRKLPHVPSPTVPAVARVALAEPARLELVGSSATPNLTAQRRFLMIRRRLFGPVPPRYIPMPLPDRFTERARRSLRLADGEARSLNHNYIGTEHVLLGLIAEHEGVAAEVLRELHIEHEAVRERVLFIIGQGDHPVTGDASTDDLTLTPRAARVIALASAEAYTLHHRFLGTEHLLLGLLREGDGIAAGVLEALGVRLDEARATTLRVLKQKEEGDN